MSKKYAIITDSGCDLTKEIVEELQVDVVPMKLMIDGKDYRHFHDFRELSMEDFYSKLRNGHIGKTSCVSIGDATDVIRTNVKKGLDVLYLSFSSGVSGSYNASKLAAETVKEEYPNADIRVIDTKSGAIGLGMVVFIASMCRKKGYSLDEVYNHISNNCLNICHYFMVDDLSFLHKSGRISTIGMIAGTTIGVRPIFIIDDEGKIKLDTKVRGVKVAIRTMVNNVVSKCTNDSQMFICHVDAEENANALKSQIKEKYPNTNITICPCGPIIGNNTGPGTIAVVFYGDKR